MDQLTFALGKFTAVPVLFAVVLTALACPLILLLYRARVVRWMKASSRDASFPADVPAPAGVILRWSTTADAAPRAAGANPIAAQVKAAVRRRTIACAAGGLASALFSTLLFGAAFAGNMSSSILAAAFVVFAAPAAIAAGHVAGRARAAASLVGALGLLFVLSGPLGELSFIVAGAFVFVPAAVFALFALRFWRSVAPYVLIITLGASLLWVIGADVGSRWLGGSAAVVWTLRIAGFAAGVWLGYSALRRVQRSWEAGSIADDDIFIDAWWTLYVLIQTLVFVLMAGPAFFIGLAGVPLYLAVKGSVGRRMASRHRSTQRPATLLLLRVFRGDRRAERLLDSLQRQWRGVGPIALIAAADVALRHIRPADFVAFATGRLRQRFVTTTGEVDERLNDRLSRRDATGDYAVSYFWCQDDTWRPVMRELAQRSDVVLMDLRGFTTQRAGVVEELRHLAQTAQQKPVVFVVDDDAELDRVRRVVPAVTAGDAAWRVVRAGSMRNGRNESAILAHLASAAALSSPPPAPAPLP